MTRFNKTHANLIGALYGLPSELEVLIDSYSQSKENLSAKHLPYTELITRFKLITKDFPCDAIDYTNGYFEQPFTDLPYPIIEQAMQSLIRNSILNIWRQHQVDEQLLPLTNKIVAVFSDIIDTKKLEKNTIEHKLKSSFIGFIHRSLYRMIHKSDHDKVMAKVEKSSDLLVRNYNGMFDELPRTYALLFIRKYAHIKAIAFTKRQEEYLRKHNENNKN